VLVKPATVVQWHRKGFRLYWRRRSRHLGRPSMSREIRGLIRQMSLANPLWGAPRIHGELLKLGIEVSQATVGRYLPWRPKVPSPTWRSFLHNHMHDTAAVDMFVVVTAAFKILYALVVLGHERRKVIHFDVTPNPSQAWLARQITEAFRYSNDAVDLCDILGSFGASGKMKLDEISRILGLAGKPDGIDGGKVEAMIAAGKIDEVARYCETDVVNTYRLWLIYELFRGAMTPEQLGWSERQLRDHVRQSMPGNPHLQAAMDLLPP
jgi:hypothetical protein